MGRKFFLFAILVIVFSAISENISVAQRRPAPAKPAANDLKIKYKMSTAGQTFESTTMLKGVRERTETRMGYGMDSANIMQCDLKRNIQISDQARKYVITPMAVNTASGTAVASSAPGGTVEPARRGGVLTYTINTIDTGERKEMFGFTARHIKTSMIMDSSPDACNPVNQKMDLDGWYIDLTFGLQCDLGQAQMSVPPASAGGCRDRVQFKNTGAGRKGYPLIETMTMYKPDGSVMMTTSKEVVELSRESLDASLFDVPVGYTEAASTQELYVAPSTSEMMPQSSSSRPTSANQRTETPTSPEAKSPGTIRVGVVQINNKTDRNISTEALRGRLVSELQGGNVEAIPLNAISQIEANAECELKKCDFILYSDIATLKSSKIGGMFGRVTGVSGASKTDAKIEFRLVAVGETSPRLQSSASAKEEGDENSAGTAAAQEARAVLAEIRRRSN